MPSIREIAKDWGVSHPYVAKCLKKGCPTDSYENARKWREDNASRRAPTDQKSLARIVAEEKQDDSPEARGRRKEYLEDKEDSTLPSLPDLPKGDPLEFARERSLRAAEEAWKLLEVAMLDPEKTSTVAMLVAIHNKAIEALVKTETMIREELERRGVIIPLMQAQEWARKGYNVIINRLSALPQNVGPRCNPSDPHHSTEILQTACVGILADAQKAFAA